MSMFTEEEPPKRLDMVALSPCHFGRKSDSDDERHYQEAIRGSSGLEAFHRSILRGLRGNRMG